MVTNVIEAHDVFAAMYGLIASDAASIGDTTPDGGVTFYRNGEQVLPHAGPEDESNDLREALAIIRDGGNST